MFKADTRKTHFFSRLDAAVIVNVHLPLVESSNRERGLTLGLGNAGVFKVPDCPTCELKEPCCRNKTKLALSRATMAGKDDVLQPTGVSANSRTVWLMMSSGKEEINAERMNHCLPAFFENIFIKILIAKCRFHGQYQRFPRRTCATLSC